MLAAHNDSFVLYSATMKATIKTPSSARAPDRVPQETLRPQLNAWAARLHETGLDGIAGVLLDAGAPLAPLGAQLLYVAQPALGLIVAPEFVGDLAQVLEAPDGIAWLRSELGLDAHELP